jgi:hypothetical protein
MKEESKDVDTSSTPSYMRKDGFISPIAWIKRTPYPGDPAFGVLVYDMGYMMWIFWPIFFLFFWLIRWFTDFRIPNEVFQHLHELNFILCFFLHCLAIKCYPYIAKINKCIARLSIKILPLFMTFMLLGRILSTQ